ncbi:hypothetical protein [Nostoc sp.]
MEPITGSAIATLAFTKAFEKTIKKFTEALRPSRTFVSASFRTL